MTKESITYYNRKPLRWVPGEMIELIVTSRNWGSLLPLIRLCCGWSFDPISRTKSGEGEEQTFSKMPPPDHFHGKRLAVLLFILGVVLLLLTRFSGEWP